MKQLLFLILIAIIACSLDLEGFRDMKKPDWVTYGGKFMSNYKPKLVQWLDSIGILEQFRHRAKEIGPEICNECWPSDVCIELVEYLNQKPK